MQMIPQFARSSHSSVPSTPLMLTAPPARLALPAPTIAGLLSAAPRMEIIRDQRPTRAEVWAQLGRVRSRDEMHTEIAALCFEALDFLSRPAPRHATRGGHA